MPAQTNKSSGPGLRILWIPSKKRHNKGVYQPTNKGIEQKHSPKKIDQWSFGGPKGQNDHEEVVKTTDIIGEASSSTLSTALIPSASIGVAAIHDESQKPHSDKLPNEKGEDDCGCSTSSSPRSTGYDTATLVIGEKKNGLSVSKRDFDSIECLDDLDATVADNNNVKQRRPVNRKKYPIENLEDDKKDEKTVKCLYYTLMCCECTIS